MPNGPARKCGAVSSCTHLPSHCSEHKSGPMLRAATPGSGGTQRLALWKQLERGRVLLRAQFATGARRRAGWRWSRRWPYEFVAAACEAGKTFMPTQASPTPVSRSAPPHTDTSQAIRLRITNSAPISRANRSWRLWAFSVPWRAARSDGVARSRVCIIRSKRPAETPPLPIRSRASASMLKVQSTMRSPMRPRPRKFAAPKAKSATRIAAMNGKIRGKNSSQDGRTIIIATSSGDNRSMKPGKDRPIVAATFRLLGRCAPQCSEVN